MLILNEGYPVVVNVYCPTFTTPNFMNEYKAESQQPEFALVVNAANCAIRRWQRDRPLAGGGHRPHGHPPGIQAQALIPGYAPRAHAVQEAVTPGVKVQIRVLLATY